MRKILLFTITGCVLFQVAPLLKTLIITVMMFYPIIVGVFSLFFIGYITWMHIRAENALINAHGLKKGRKLYQNGVMAEWINNHTRWDV